MKTSATDLLVSAMVSIATISWATDASAAVLTPIYSVTDLGTSFQLQTDSSGHAHSVTSGDGGQTYAFDKSPVTPIREYFKTSTHIDSFMLFTLQNGSHKVGYSYDQVSGTSDRIDVPTGVPFTGGWHSSGAPAQTQNGMLYRPGPDMPFLPQSQLIFPGVSPVSDLNSQGQFVGTSLFVGKGGTFAAFSNINGQDHNFNLDSSVVDNLNNYIATIPGVTLTSALKIDDLGRILAVGDHGHDFLLTPNGLSSDPIPAPEPTTLALLALTSAGFVARRRSRR